MYLLMLKKYKFKAKKSEKNYISVVFEEYFKIFSVDNITGLKK